MYSGVRNGWLGEGATKVAEWRPFNIAEDNKAATWEDTSAFLVNIYSGHGYSYNKYWNGNILTVSYEDRFEAPKRCLLSEREFLFVSTKSTSISAVSNIDLTKIDPLSISVREVPNLGYWSVSMHGANEGPLGTTTEMAIRDHVAVNDVMLGAVKSKLLPTTCSADEKHCHAGEPAVSREDEEHFRDQESAKRFARALMHAALLCGGTKAVSPF